MLRVVKVKNKKKIFFIAHYSTSEGNNICILAYFVCVCVFLFLVLFGFVFFFLNRTPQL